MTTDNLPAELPQINSLWDFSKPEKSEAAFRNLLPVANKLGNEAYRLQLLTQVARAQGLQRKFEEAHATLDEVATQLPDIAAIVHVRYHLERGRVFNSSQKREESKPQFLKAWQIARDAGEDNLAVDAAHMLGIVEPADEALRWNEQAMTLAEQSADATCRNWLGSLYNNIGWTYHDKGDYRQALELFEKALAFREEKKQAPEIRIARWCIARTLRSLNRIDEALAMQQALLQEHKAAGTSDGYVVEELGECLLLLERANDATKFFSLAYQELSKDDWLTSNEPDRIARLKLLGNVV